jgi:hypothetical protein
MWNKSLVRILALVAVAALAVPALAKPVSKNINLPLPARVGTAQLTVGDYRILVDGSKVTVQQGKKILAEVEGRWEERGRKQPQDSIQIGPNGQVQEIRFGGDSRVLVLSTP